MTTKITPTEKLVFDLEDTEMPSINQRSEFILFYLPTRDYLPGYEGFGFH